MVHPALEPYVLAARERPQPHPATMSIPERRDAFRAATAVLAGEPQAVQAVVEGTIALPGRTLRTRLFVPYGDGGTGLVLFFHGGAFVMGDLDTDDALCRRLAADTAMRFLAVEYRLAPEHPFPAAVDDAIDALRHVATHLDEFAGADAALVVMGDSAGASLAAIASALTRHEGLNVAAQVLIYPTLGPEVVTASSHDYGTGYLFELEHLRYDYRQYLGGWSDHTDPRVTPLMFDDLSGAPPAVVLVAQFDPLRDEGVAYAGLLEHFGVEVELLEAEQMIHGFLEMAALVPDTWDVVDDLGVHLRRFVERSRR
ncbi:MAG: alpha/beta hydrolase [Acidimicrobiales bacterium]|jgi:acetyl esterase